MVLTDLEFVSGLFSVLIIIFTMFVGLSIMGQYFKTKSKVFLYVGFTWIFIVEAWYSSATSFILVLLTDTPLPAQIYFLIGMPILPLVMILWLLAYTELTENKKKKIIVLLYSISGLIFEIIFFAALFINPSIIGELEGPVNAKYSFILLGYVLFLLITFLVTGVQFSRGTFNSEKPEIRLKGKLLIIAFISFTIGTIIDGFLSINIIALVLIRLLVISAALEFYAGFILPDWVKKIFIKKI